MTALIDGIFATGTPAEISEFIKISGVTNTGKLVPSLTAPLGTDISRWARTTGEYDDKRGMYNS